MVRRCSGTVKRSTLNVASLVLALAVILAVAGSSFAVDGRDGNAYVNHHRDRLLDTYAQHKGLGNRVNAWNSLSYKQKMLFLIQTDLLGNRTFMRPVSTDYYLNNPNDNGFKNVTCGNGNAYCGTCTPMGGVQYCTTCEVYTEITDWGMGCKEVTAWDCYQAGLCYQAQPRPRTDYEMALEHVTWLYEILGYGGFDENCGGDDNNRIFWQADDKLINAFRNRTMPGWGANVDLKGSHPPFDNSSATLNGQPDGCKGPDGQAQFWSWDTVCGSSGQQGCSKIVPFARGSAYLPADPRMFELDDDYNSFADGFPFNYTIGHDSSPLCHYCGGQYAGTMYQNLWCGSPVWGNAASCDWYYTPTPASYPVSVTKSGTGTGTISSYPGGINCGTTCSANYSSGSQVTLTATADSGSTFAGWSGACTGTGNCTVMMDAAKSVSVTFNQNVWYTLSAGKSGTGKGTVTSNSGTTCNATCSGISGWFMSGSQVTLTATADSGSTFAGWSGACSGTGTCAVTMNGSQSVTATFNTASSSNAYYCYSSSYPSYGYQNWLCNAAYNPTYCYTSNWQSTTCPSVQQSNAYYCYSTSYPSYGYQNWLCNAAYHPTYCYTSSWQSTTCPSSGSTSVCGNGICETGENGSNCGQDCCDQSTACNQTKQNGGVYYCRNMYHYDTGWRGFQWITQDDAMQMCNEWYEAWEGSSYQTQYQCGGTSGKCHSIPGGYY